MITQLTLFLYILMLISSLAGVVRGKAYLYLLAKILFFSAFIIHSTMLILRSLEAGHLPMFSMYETLLLYSWCVSLLSLFVLMKYRINEINFITIPICCLALVVAFFNIEDPRPLPLVLDTYWFELHVTTSFVAYSFFTLAFASSIVYLLKVQIRKSGTGNYSVAQRSAVWGFFLFSASMFAGAVWAYLAWGIYWLWEPKVLWSFIVWFFYAGVVHVIYLRRNVEKAGAIAMLPPPLLWLLSFMRG